MLTLPVRPLRERLRLQRPAHGGAKVGSYPDTYWRDIPEAVGIGAGGEVVALWGHAAHKAWALTRHNAQGRAQSIVTVSGACHSQFVQPLPDGHTLLVEARSPGGSRGGENAAVYDSEGRWVRGAHLGDAVEHVLATTAGAVWVGYFDEAAAHGNGLGGHGLVRFGTDLAPQWLYPFNSDLPAIWDCLGLNVTTERVWAYIYNRPERLISVEGDHACDQGPSLVQGADTLLIDGSRAALIGGNAAEYDLITPIALTPGGAHPAGPSSRLILPDGSELPRLRHQAQPTCRGPELHIIIGSTWYRLDPEDALTS